MIPSSRHHSSFRVLGRHVRIRAHQDELDALVASNFSAMAWCGAHGDVDLDYEIVVRAGRYLLSRDGAQIATSADRGELLYDLEKDLTVELQRRRQDLFFLHAAALERSGRVFLLAAESGSGKSTTTWGLLHHGFRYLSDELSPIDLASMQVWPYPHALCLKSRPPHYPLPDKTVDLGRTLHVPVPSLPVASIEAPLPLGGILLVQYSPDRSAPRMQRISASEAAAHLYVNTLNALAHSNSGLDGVARIAQALPCYAVEAADLRETCDLIRNTVDPLLCMSNHGAPLAERP